MHSLRGRLLSGVVVSTLTVFAVAGVGLYLMLRAVWLAEFDGSLDIKARSLAALVEYRPEGLRLDVDPGQMTEFQGGPHPEYYVIVDGRGTVAFQSATFATPPPDEWSKPARKLPFHAFVILPSGKPGRLTQIAFIPHLEDKEAEPDTIPPCRITIAREISDFDDNLTQLIGILIGVFGAAALMSGVSLLWVIGRGLRPLAALAERIHTIGTRNLSERLEAAEAPAEVQPVVERLNELLGKVDAHLLRERAFTADVAHELRTPLSGLITAMQVCLTQARTAGEYQQLLARCLTASGSMRSMVENLLTLARADAKQITIHPRPADFHDLLEEQWRQSEGLARTAELQVDWRVPSPMPFTTDAGLLGTVIRNLFDNAVTYCNRGGMIRVEACYATDAIILKLTNSGSHVAASDALRVFERFWRGDDARTTVGAGHHGLGLALCERVIGVLGGTIAVKTSKGGDFDVDVRIPREQD